MNQEKNPFYRLIETSSRFQSCITIRENSYGFFQKQIIVTKVVDQFEFGFIGRSLNMEVIVNEMEIAIQSRFLFQSHAKDELFHILG